MTSTISSARPEERDLVGSTTLHPLGRDTPEDSLDVDLGPAGAESLGVPADV